MTDAEEQEMRRLSPESGFEESPKQLTCLVLSQNLRLTDYAGPTSLLTDLLSSSCKHLQAGAFCVSDLFLKPQPEEVCVMYRKGLKICAV